MILNFSSKKYIVTIRTRSTQIVSSTFLIKTIFIKIILKIVDLQNQIPITFRKASIRILKVRNPTPHIQISNL